LSAQPLFHRPANAGCGERESDYGAPLEKPEIFRVGVEQIVLRGNPRPDLIPLFQEKWIRSGFGTD